MKLRSVKLRSGPVATVRASMSLAAWSGAARHRRAITMVRRGGVAAAVGLAALRAPDHTVLVRDHDTVTGTELDRAVRATAAALAERWPVGTRLGLRGDGGIDFIVALAAAGMAGLDAMPIGPRHGADDLAALAEALDEIVDPWEVAVRDPIEAPPPNRPAGRLLVLSTGSRGTPTATARGRLGTRALVQLADAERRLRLPSGPVLVLAPPDHGHGLAMVVAGLTRGRTVVLASGMRPAEQAGLVARRRPETVTGVPAQLGRLLDAEPAALDGVRVVVSGSSLLPDALRARLSRGGMRVLDCYGSTETGTVAIEGRPLAGVTIEVDAAGRILIRSPLGGRSPRDPGDVGRVHQRRLVVEGRRGPLVDSGGELIAPERVAAALRAVPGVLVARVTADPDDLLGSVLHAEVTVSAEGGPDESALRSALSETLSRAELPRRIVVVRANVSAGPV